MCAAATLDVLVVEDDALLLYSIAHALRGEGWLVLEARTGAEAIALWMLPNEADVGFTDIQLLGPLSGWDVADACRSSRHDMPVIYTSGKAADRRRAVVGSHSFDKPYVAASGGQYAWIPHALNRTASLVVHRRDTWKGVSG